MSQGVRIHGYAPRAASGWTTAAVVVWTTGWLVVSLLPGLAPTASGLVAEAPFVAAATLVLLALLGVALWVDADRAYPPLGVVAGVVAANAVVQLSFSIASGVELHHLLPFALGMAAGGPAGFFAGATSMLLAQFVQGTIGTALTAQILVGGLAGLLGGACRALAGRRAWLLAPAAGLGHGLLAGPLLALAHWPVDAQASPAFLPVAPVLTNLIALVTYARYHTLGIDLLRGLLTAAGLLLVGFPLTRFLERFTELPALDATAADAPDVAPAVLQRLARARKVHTMWKAGTHD